MNNGAGNNDQIEAHFHSGGLHSSDIFELILANDYDSIDETLTGSLAQIRNRGGHRCWHKHSTFLDHLLNVHNILRLWEQTPKVGRVGLFHSAYSNSYVNLALFYPNQDSERDEMKKLVGSDADLMIHLFCVIDRQKVVVKTLLANGYIPKDGLNVNHLREDSTIFLSAEILKMLTIFTMADVADQYFGWQDRLFGGIRQENSMLSTEDDDELEHESTSLWPGPSQPGLWMSYVSELGAVAKTYEGEDESSILPVPALFDNCTITLSKENERKASDLYWSFVMNLVPEEAVIDSLKLSIEYNPWYFEGYVMLAQKCLHINRKADAEKMTSRALELQRLWGTAYDKRLSFPAWVSWTRVLQQRSKSILKWPTNSWEVNNFGMVH